MSRTPVCCTTCIDRKSRSFTPPSEDRKEPWNLRYNPSVHGVDGSLKTCFAGLISPGDLAMQAVRC